jgi:hypothetical protein
VVEFIKKLKAKDLKYVMFLRVDKANENYALKSRVEKEGLNVQSELTSPNTSKQNGPIARGFVTLWGCVGASLNVFRVGEDSRHKNYAAGASTATKICNIAPNPHGKCPYEMPFSEKLKM